MKHLKYFFTGLIFLFICFSVILFMAGIFALVITNLNKVPYANAIVMIALCIPTTYLLGVVSYQAGKNYWNDR